MQRRLFIILFLLLGITFLAAQNQTIINSKPLNKPYKHTLTTDPLSLVFGMGNVGYEYRFIKRASLSASAYFGKMLFVDMENSYAAFLRYYKGYDPTYGLFFQTGYSHLEASYKGEKAKVSSIHAGLGYRFLKSGIFTFDLGGGVSFSSDEKVEYEKRSGNVTQTVTLGGPVAASLTLSAGFSF